MIDRARTWSAPSYNLRAFTRACCGLILVAIAFCNVAAAGATTLRIVAVGASNTSGWLIPQTAAYPAVLKAMLKATGIHAEITNAGRPFDTTSGMLARLEEAVPNGTQLVILQPGGNDLRFLGSKEQRAANVQKMVQLLRARSIDVIVYDEEIAWRYVFDGIHLTPEGHRMIASALLPKIVTFASRPRIRDRIDSAKP